jgi:uncharacterized protein (TIGR03546 family)
MPRMIFLRPFRFLAQALLLDATPAQLAWGFALGMVIGLVPKGNLIAVCLMTLLCALRVNFAAGTLGIFAFTWAGMYLDPYSHRLGHFLLTHPSLQSLWTSLYDTNVVPWTSFNNTVVLGSTLIGLTMVFPVYRLSHPIFARYAPLWAEYVRKYRVVQVLHGGELTGNLA